MILLKLWKREVDFPNRFFSPSNIALILIFLTLTGCARLGPATLRGERKNYNVAIQKTNDEQLLLNLVRLKYRDTPFFMEVSSVASQMTLGASLDGSVSITDPIPNIYGIGGGANYSEKPTITYAPLQGDQFIQRVLSPIPVESLSLLYHSGWSIERIFRASLQRLNKLKNAPGASGPTPQYAPVYEKFQLATKRLRLLQTRDLIDIVFSEIDGFPSLILEISPEASGLDEFQGLARSLGVSPEAANYTLSTNANSKDPNHILIVPRSLLGIMFYLSQGVEAPLEDQQSGKVTLTKYRSGEPFDWGLVTGDLMRIRSGAGDFKPDTATIAVHYRGNWFYIEDSDLNSKSTFSLLSQIFSLQAGKIKSVSPLLTLPIGQ